MKGWEEEEGVVARDPVLRGVFKVSESGLVAKTACDTEKRRLHILRGELVFNQDEDWEGHTETVHRFEESYNNGGVASLGVDFDHVEQLLLTVSRCCEFITRRRGRQTGIWKKLIWRHTINFLVYQVKVLSAGCERFGSVKRGLVGQGREEPGNPSRDVTIH